MSSSSKQKQGMRRITPVAESLEGRQLLSTATTTTVAAPAAVSTPPGDPGSFAPPWMTGAGGFFGGFSGGFSGRYDMRAMMSGAGASLGSTTSPVDSSTAPTASSTSVAVPTSSAPANAILPWAGGMFGMRDGFGGQDGFSNFGGATASTVQVGAAQGFGAIASSAGSAGSGVMTMSPFVGKFGGAMGGMGVLSIIGDGSTAVTSTGATGVSATPTPSPYAQAEQTAFQQLQTDEQAIHDKSQVTPALQAAFRNDVTALAKEVTTSPSATSVLALKSDLSTLAGTLPTSDQLTTLQTDLTTVLTSAGVTDTTGVTKTFSDLGAILTATNIGSGDITTLTTDLKAAGLSTSTPLIGADLGVNLDSLSSVVIAGVKATAPTTTTTTSTGTTTTTS
jgi:hypothetical protein